MVEILFEVEEINNIKAKIGYEYSLKKYQDIWNTFSDNLLIQRYGLSNKSK